MIFSEQLLNYALNIASSEPAVLTRIRQRNQQHRLGKMMIRPETMQVLCWLANLLNVKKYLEIGVFTGYSSTAMALCLPEQAHITACDINLTYTTQAQQAWQEAGVSHKITLHLQPALITLEALEKAGEVFDFALIDADKLPTAHYVEACLKLIRQGGIIAVDNVLLKGKIIHEDDNSTTTRAMQKFLDSLQEHPKLEPILIPIGDGLLLLRKHN